MNDVTVLYYSANVEDPKFEARIREKILANKGDLPLVSVTQEPAPGFGKNICVGKHFKCYGNEFRQIQVGLKAVETEYVITAEADVLYPPEYFQFQPTGADYYRYGNVWVHYVRRERSWNEWSKKAFFKLYSDGAQIMRKDFWLGLIEKALGEEEKWYTEKDEPKMIYRLETDAKFTWVSENPVITFKTYNGVRRFTSIKKNTPPTEVLPYWGDINVLRKEMFS